MIRDPAHIGGYGTAFEGVISLGIRDDDGTVIAETSTQGGSNGIIGEFKANVEFSRRPDQRLGIVEAFEAGASGPGEELTWTGFRSPDRGRLVPQRGAPSLTPREHARSEDV